MWRRVVLAVVARLAQLEHATGARVDTVGLALPLALGRAQRGIGFDLASTTTAHRGSEADGEQEATCC